MPDPKASSNKTPTPSQGAAGNPNQGNPKPSGQASQGPGAVRGGQKQAVQVATQPASFRIRPISKREHHLKLLIYGNYGVGKTYLAGSAVEVPHLRDVLLINAEAGDLTLEEFGGQIDEVTVQDFRTLARVYEFLKHHCKARDEKNDEKLREIQERVFGEPVPEDVEPRQYRTVIIDSLTEVNQYCLNQLLGILDTTKLDDDPVAAEFKEYKQNNTMMLRLVRNFRNLPMHVIFTAAEDYIQDETKRQKFTPAMTGKLSKQIQGFMDMVGYYVTAKKAETDTMQPRRLYVTPSETGKYDAKHRYTKFKGMYFDNPTIAKILQETGLSDQGGALIR